MNPRHGPGDWAMLLALTAMWGSAFLLTKIAVGGYPAGLAGGRAAWSWLPLCCCR